MLANEDRDELEHRGWSELEPGVFKDPKGRVVRSEFLVKEWLRNHGKEQSKEQRDVYDAWGSGLTLSDYDREDLARLGWFKHKEMWISRVGHTQTSDADMKKELKRMRDEAERKRSERGYMQLLLIYAFIAGAIVGSILTAAFMG